MKLDNYFICNKNYALFITNYIKYITKAFIIVSIIMNCEARCAIKRVTDIGKETDITARTPEGRLFLSDKLTLSYY